MASNHVSVASKGLNDASKRSLLKSIATRRFAQIDCIPAQVRPRLYIGSVGAAENIKLLSELGITHVLSVGGAEMLTQLKLLEGAVLAHLKVELSDRTDGDIASIIPLCMDFMSTSISVGGAVLVHCFHGKSRSAGLQNRNIIILHK
jgi:predicted protein tyrosine phosphatase